MAKSKRSIERDSELADFGLRREAGRPVARPTKPPEKTRMTFYLDAGTVERLQALVGDLRRDDVRTSTNREMNVHYLGQQILMEMSRRLMEGDVTLHMPTARASEIEVGREGGNE